MSSSYSSEEEQLSIPFVGNEEDAYECGYGCECNNCLRNDKYGRSYGDLDGDAYHFPTSDIEEDDDPIDPDEPPVPENECAIHGPILMNPRFLIGTLEKDMEIGDCRMCQKCMDLFSKHADLKETYWKDPPYSTTLLLEVCKLWNMSDEIVKIFIGENPSWDYINFQNKYGNTALHYVAYAYINEDYGYRCLVTSSIIETATMLLEKGANLSIQNEDGKSPYDLFEYGYNTKYSDPDYHKIERNRHELVDFKKRSEFFLNIIQGKYGNFDIKTPDAF